MACSRTLAGEHLRATHEAGRVQHQAQGQQRTVAALLLGVAARRLRHGPRLALEVGVRQVVEGHRRLEVEQPHRGVEQVRLERLPVRHQRVRGPVQLHRAHGLEVHAEQFADGAALAQPAVRGAFGGRERHARDDRAERRVAQRRVDAERREQRRKAEFAERPQRDVLDADRARPGQHQGVHGDRVDAAAGVAVARGTPGEELRDDALRLALDVPGHVVEQLRLAGQRLLDALAQQRPQAAVDVEVAAEVDQRALADPAAVAFRTDQAVGVVGPAVGLPGLGAPDEHAGTVAARGGARKAALGLQGATLAPTTVRARKSKGCGSESPQNRCLRPEKQRRIGKLGLPLSPAPPRPHRRPDRRSALLRWVANTAELAPTHDRDRQLGRRRQPRRRTPSTGTLSDRLGYVAVFSAARAGSTTA